MRLQIFHYHCGACSQWYEAAALSGLVYGEFLLRAASGETRYLNANRDSTFAEVDRLIGNDPRAETLDPFQRADVLHAVFGVACDQDSQGNDFRIGLKARCTHCGQANVIDWQSTEPPQHVEQEVPPVTHDRWSVLLGSEKQSQISAAWDALSLD